MTDTPEKTQGVSRLSNALQAAVLAIRWERLWRVLWAPVAVITLFIGVALTDVLPLLPDALHGVALALLAVLFGYSLKGMSGAFGPVTGTEAARRVEAASGLKHRPLTALFDTPAQEKLSSDGRQLWSAHIDRALRQTENLAYPAPKPGVAALDRRGLRFVPVLVLFVGVLMGGTQPLERIIRAVLPIGSAGTADAVSMDLWITPPAYTGLAPSVFNDIGRPPAETGGEAVADAMAPNAARPTLIVPVGSQILVHATGAHTAPSLALGKSKTPLAQLGDATSTSYKLELSVTSDAAGSDRLAVGLGTDTLAEWPVVIATDSTPAIEFERAPSKQRDTQLEVIYLASDDYGVKSVEMTIRRPNGRPVPGGEAEIRVEVPLSGDRRDIKATHLRDFSAHPWAGLPVQVKLIATDTAGQTAETDAVEVVLPERIFNHPVARQLADARKVLNDADPDVMDVVADQLHELSLYPKRFFDDTVAFLSIRSAAGRLGYAEDTDVVPAVQRLLWETALRIEDGEFALAEADLMRLQEEAMQALRDGKLGEELDQVMRELQEAMDRYMQALVDRLQEMGLDELPQMPDSAEIQTQDIQEMLDKIRELAETGNRDAAEQMLAQMQQMLEQLRQGLKMQQSNPAMAEAKKLMDGLRSLTQDQQELLDRTFQEGLNRQTQRPRMGQQGQQQQGQQQQGQRQPGQQGEQQQGQQGQQGQQQAGEQGAPTQEQQDALRKRLGELMMQMDELMGQIPDNLGKAEQQMEQSGKNLGKGELSDSARNQTQALEELRNATNQMSQMLAQQFGQQMGITSGQQSMPGREGQFDPFGRRNTNENGQGAAVEDADVSVPNRSEMRRAREILDELRRRAGERARPKLELDYIDRLLDIF
ncbi:MAG: TIGR02302 family protein [Rhodospirillales bacterium]|nr:TIGR02302 family protein [Rhodospirillales bacterium]MBO6785318.1 TIGR02302 family protein [Rhodospirillales bacterium]